MDFTPRRDVRPDDEPLNEIDRRRVLSALGTGGVLALAGCVGGGESGEPAGGSDPATEAPADETETVTETETREADSDPSLEPAPTGEPLSAADIEALVGAFDSEPIRGGQDTPKHVFKWVSDDTFLFLHFNKPNPLEADYIEYVGVATKSVFSKESQPDDSFTHFHKAYADSWDGGHGGTGGEEGYWFSHVAATDFEAPWGQVSPGVDYNFMPTPPPAHDGDGTADFDVDDQGTPSGDELADLVELFDDEPIRGGQDTPKHVFKWLTEDVFMFLHLDNPDVSQAENVDYFGVAVRGEFTEESQPHSDFTHFHKWSAESWDGGHGGEADHKGYWFAHVAATEHEEPWGSVEVGIDRNFMPTPPPG